ncbi:MAG: VWA domain-containing protein [Clostridia bacterium]|nr:VWA domain-containing protein [Clostridia bacterium]
MSLDFTTYWGLLGLLAIPILLLIYFLKQKYVEKPVSSTFIWKKSLKYVKTKIPINIIVSLLLILQILSVIVASLALCRPTLVAFSSDETVIVIDSSASMLAKNDQGKTRFELAVEQAKKDAEKAGPNSKITVITAGEKANTVVYRSEDKSQIVNALDKIKCEYGNADFEEAKLLVADVQSQNKETSVKYYTDQTYESVNGFEYIDFSKDNDSNIAITSLEDGMIKDDYVFTLEVSNYGKALEKVKIKAVINDGKKDLWFEDTYSFGESETRMIYVRPNISALEEGTGLKIDSFEEYKNAKFEIVVDDAIAEDNVSSIYPEEKKDVKILYVSEYVQYIEGTENTDAPVVNDKFIWMLRIFGYLGYTVDTTSDVYKSINDVPDLEGYDIYIFEGESNMPEILPTDGAVWFINPKTNPVGTDIEIGDELEEMFAYPVITPGDTNPDTDTYEIITNGIKMDGQWYVGKYKNTPANLPDKYEAVFKCGNNAPLIIAGIEEENNTRVVVFTFDIYNSNLIMQFVLSPVLFDNLVKFSAPDSLVSRDFVVGDELEFKVPVGGTALEVRDPSDQIIYSTANASEYVQKLDMVGDYKITVTYGENGTKSFMVPVHISAEESDINMNAYTEVVQSPPATAPIDRSPIEIWPYLVALLLILLIVEWGVYYKDEF